MIPPLMKELCEKSKPLLDTIKKLQNMVVFDKTLIMFPKIIVLDEASAGTSVISSLVGIKLPSGLRFPIVLKFTDDDEDDDPSRKIWFEFQFENSHCEKEVSETCLANEILKFVKTVPIYRRSEIELTLTVTQPQVSDLTIILLPEIHTHQDKDEEKKEMELLQGYIEQYTRDNECLFLSVLLGSSNFDSCLSKKVLKRLGYIGTRNITIFTKIDLCSEYMIALLTSEKFETSTPFGYFFIDNMTEYESEDDDEYVLKVDKDYVGFGVISKNLVIALLSILFDSFKILERIESDLEKSKVEIKQCERTFDTVKDAIPMILSVVTSTAITFHNLFVTHDYEGYENVGCMHAASIMAIKFKKIRSDLHDLKLDKTMPFLQFEIELLDPRKSNTWLSFVSSCNIKPLLTRQFSLAFNTINLFVSSIMDYIEYVLVKILLEHGKTCLQLRLFFRRIGCTWTKGLRKSFQKKVDEIQELEKRFIYTCSDNFSRKLDEMKSVKLELDTGKDYTSIEGLGSYIRVGHLRDYDERLIERAFEMRKRFVVYWGFVVDRFVDNCALNLQSLIKEMMTVGVENVIRKHVTAGFKDESKLPDVEPAVVFMKGNLERRVGYLERAKKDIQKWQVEFDL